MNVVTEKTMEMKKTQIQPVATSNQKEKEAAAAVRAWKVRDFVGDVKDEIQKISWTSSQELKTYTQLVVGATFFFGMGIYTLDLVIQAVLTTLSATVRYVAG